MASFDAIATSLMGAGCAPEITAFRLTVFRKVRTISTVTPRNPSSPIVTLMCMKSLRRPSLGLIARKPNTPAPARTTWGSMPSDARSPCQDTPPVPTPPEEPQTPRSLSPLPPLRLYRPRVSVAWMNRGLKPSHNSQPLIDPSYVPLAACFTSRQHLLRRPLVAGVKLHHLAVRARSESSTVCG